ncbi:immunoglobulin superfamily member 2 [Leptonychotes weddellii]|uniref:immunoglobulin superfamily member 2 n=1 Tax=Leptonychotes weddellii TaxID=9713 RepID=UPI00123E645B|nr:immunoglobulin superfamily member 2 [Leptonychotes weddellii]
MEFNSKGKSDQAILLLKKKKKEKKKKTSKAPLVCGIKAEVLGLACMARTLVEGAAIRWHSGDWSANLFLFPFLSFSSLQAKLSFGQREVTIQKGPLFRAAGYPISIGCNVTGHQGPAEQHFQWSVYLPKAPTQEVQIVSTKDATFSYAVYAQRVRSRGIYVERVRGNSVFLHISELQPKDSGEYECHTPNTDERYYGNYSAKTRLIVIPDTLSATMSPQTLHKEEGESLELTCEASKATAQHTHLSVTWYLMQDGERNQTTKIISLSKDFLLIPGSSYTERFAAGDVQLSKLGVATFRLSIGRLQPSDQGQLFCEATEWIQDPDETWTLITRKRTAQTALRMQPTVRDFQVNISAESTFTAGKSLELVCLVVGSGRDPLLQGVWFFNGNEMARMDAGGVLDLKGDYRQRASQGQLQVSKLSPKAFSLKIFSAGPEDEGVYRCAVAEMARAQMGSWQVLQSKRSPDSHVHLRKPAESSLWVKLMSRQPKVELAKTFGLSCIVEADYANLRVPLTVTWQFQPARSQVFHPLVRITHNGTIEWGGFLSQFQKKTKVLQSSFHSQLLIHDATEEEAGVYQCKVEVYVRNSLCTSGPVRASAISHSLMIAITLPESKLQVNSSSQVQEILINSNTNIECNILSRSTGDLQLAVIWYFSPSSTKATWLKILQMDKNNVVKYGDEFHTLRRKQKFYPEKVSQDLFQLHVLNMEDSDQGKYHCAVEEWLLSTNGTWLKLGEKKSGLTELKLRPTGSTVRVSKGYRTENATEHGEVAIHCSLESSGSSASLFSVMWYRNRENSGRKMLVHLQHDGLLEYGEEGFRRHLHCYRSSPTDFVLKLHRVEMEDAGLYWCRVTEWQLHGSPSKWVNQASDESQHMVLMVLPSEPTFPSRICSSTSLLYFLLVFPCILLILLPISLLCWYHKARKLSALSLKAQNEKALWVNLKGAGDWTTNRKEEEEEDD